MAENSSLLAQRGVHRKWAFKEIGSVEILSKFFKDYYLLVNDIMDHYHITSIVNYTNYARRLIEQEDLDHSGVT